MFKNVLYNTYSTRGAIDLSANSNLNAAKSINYRKWNNQRKILSNCKNIIFMHISTPNAYTNTEVDYDLAAKSNLSTTYTNTRVDSTLAATPN